MTSIGRIFKARDNGADLIYFAIHLAMGAFPKLVFLVTFGGISIMTGLGSYFSDLYKDIVPNYSSVTVATFIFLVCILIEDFFHFFKHYLAHKIQFLWDLHEFHHSATEMTILNAKRNLPLQEVFTNPIAIPFEALTYLLILNFIKLDLIFPIILYGGWVSLTLVLNALGHSSSVVIFPKPIRYILMSPSLHWIHHSDSEEHYDSNFGERFVFWDKLFGSYKDEKQIENIKGFGVKGSQYLNYNPFYSFLVLPFVKLSKRMKFLIS